jgi:hypothetical protein
LSELVTIAKAISRGGSLVSKSGIYRALSVAAAQRREDGKSVQQSFAKMISIDPVARELFNVHQALGRRALTACDPDGPLGREILKGLRREIGQPDSAVDGSAYPAPPAGDDEPDLDDLVRDRMRAKPGMSKQHAMVDVLDTAVGKRAYGRERDVRLRKALGGG